MNKNIIITIIIVAVILILGLLFFRSPEEPTDDDVFTIQESREIAETWITNNSPTHLFDGSKLELVSEQELIQGKTYSFLFSFESSSAGYGDRTDEPTAQVITPHQMDVTVQEGSVISAITDEVYDEIKAELIDEPKDEPPIDEPPTDEPTITLFSPDENDEWEVGGTYEIRWEGGETLKAEKFNIFLVDHSRGTYAGDPATYIPYTSTIIASNVPTRPGSYSWEIPSTVLSGDEYKLVIEDGHFVYAESDDYFSVIMEETKKKEFICGNEVTFVYGGETVAYGTVENAGQCWMDRNLGAERVAQSHDDEKSYGDLFQWGRGDDGHQDRESETIKALSSADSPGHDKFISYADGYRYDWRHSQNDNLWQGDGGINEPCPEGWRIATEEEWELEKESWATNDTMGAFNSSLKLPAAGYRSIYDGGKIITGDSCYNCGSYWSSTISSFYARYLGFDEKDVAIDNHYRGNGYSVRCIKDKSIVDATSDWKIYRNEEYGYKVKYPRDWAAEKISERSSSFYKTDAPQDLYGKPAFPITITIENNPQQLPIDQWIEQNKEDLILSEKESIIIDETPGVKFIEAGMVSYLSVYVGKKSTIYRISTPDNSEYLSTFNQILSTFKWTE